MLLKQARYFVTVVDANSFTEAAEQLYVSQSAVSQQIKALEEDLGTRLMIREKRKFSLTPAGEYFYRRCKAMVGEADAIVRETVRIGRGENNHLQIGYLSVFQGQALHQAVAKFSEIYPDVRISLRSGTHEELYYGLLNRELDIALNDQRRAFSDEYVNLELAMPPVLIEISSRHYLSELPQVEIEDLHALPCILLSGTAQREIEQRYYHNILGFPGEFLFAETMEDARLMVVSGQGYLPVENVGSLTPPGVGTKRIPVLRHGAPLRRRYCAFWRKERGNEYVETFADLLRKYIAAPGTSQNE